MAGAARCAIILRRCGDAIRPQTAGPHVCDLLSERFETRLLAVLFVEESTCCDQIEACHISSPNIPLCARLLGISGRAPCRHHVSLRLLRRIEFINCPAFQNKRPPRIATDETETRHEQRFDRRPVLRNSGKPSCRLLVEGQQAAVNIETDG